MLSGLSCCKEIPISCSTASLGMAFEHFHIGFAGPFQGVMLMIIIDAYSEWPEVFVMQNTNVSKTIEPLNHLFQSYGYPEQVETDNGPQFVAHEFAIFMQSCGIKHITSVPCHPSTNGLAERFVQSVKLALKASKDSGVPFSERLCSFPMTYQSSEHNSWLDPKLSFLKARD